MGRFRPSPPFVGAIAPTNKETMGPKQTQKRTPIFALRLTMRNGFYMNLNCASNRVGPVYLRGYVKLYENTLPSHPARPAPVTLMTDENRDSFAEVSGEYFLPERAGPFRRGVTTNQPRMDTNSHDKIEDLVHVVTTS